ncbi:MAG TPA: hypothetical protein VFX51_20305, partial [Solirubrobacteraceae bacterium]|nr:hypothetical protein [Solirubrobacteraceae bacterium]
MTLPRLCLPLALLGFGFVAAPAAAAPVPLLNAPSAQEVALAGTDVVVARTVAHGGVLVDVVPSQGGAARRLLTVAPRGRGSVSAVLVAASPQRVAVLTGVERGNRVERRLYTGPPAGPLQLDIQTSGGDFFPVDAAVDGERVLVVEERTSGGTRARLFSPGSPPRTVPWPGEIIPPVALSGSRAAFVGTDTRATEQLDLKLLVIDVNTGAAQVSLPTEAPVELALAPDGHVVVESGTGLFTVAPGGPATPLPGSGFMLRPRLAGAAVAALERTRLGAVRPAVLDPGSATPRPLGTQSFDARDIAADDRGVAWIAHGCVLFAPIGGTAGSEPPAGPCPRSEATVDSLENALHGRTVKLVATCVAAPARGCRGTV